VGVYHQGGKNGLMPAVRLWVQRQGWGKKCDLTSGKECGTRRGGESEVVHGGLSQGMQTTPCARKEKAIGTNGERGPMEHVNLR